MNTGYSQDTFLQRPLTIVDEVLEQNVKQYGFNHDAIKNTQATVRQIFQQQFEHQLQQIPLLTKETYNRFQRHTLVRVKCMVQDMLDQEMFPGLLKSGDQLKSVLYRDELSSHDDMNDDDATDCVIADRNLVYCVPIPGETDWVKQANRSLTESILNNNDQTKGKKRAREEDSEQQEVSEDVNMSSGNDAQVKRSRSEHTTSNSTTSTPNPEAKFTLDFPLPDENGLACLIKLYDRNEDSFKLCELIEVVGILTDNAEQFASEYNQQPEDEFLTVYPPQSLVPRIQCIFFSKIQSVHHPFADSSKLSQIQTVLSELRPAAISYISQALKGDLFASEYVLLHLLSRIYSRAESLNLGKLVLNLTRCPVTDGFSNTFNQVLSSIVPSCYLLKISPDNLESIRFAPKKNFTTNKLNSGILQLPVGTQLVIDENALSQGKLKERAVLNLQALHSVINQTTVSYDFTYNKMDFQTDFNICILSDGRSLFKHGVDCTVPIIESQTTPSNLNSQKLDQIRNYISLMNCMNAGIVPLDYTINQAVHKMVETDFVELRSSESGGPETLHLWLVLGKLLVLSHGQTELTGDMWVRMRNMEKERLQRIALQHSSVTKQQ